MGIGLLLLVSFLLLHLWWHLLLSIHLGIHHVQWYVYQMCTALGFYAFAFVIESGPSPPDSIVLLPSSLSINSMIEFRHVCDKTNGGLFETSHFSIIWFAKNSWFSGKNPLLNIDKVRIEFSENLLLICNDNISNYYARWDINGTSSTGERLKCFQSKLLGSFP